MCLIKFFIEHAVMGVAGYSSMLAAAYLIAKRNSGPYGPLFLGRRLAWCGVAVSGWVIAVQNFN